MIVYNIVVRIANDKDFLAPIFSCISRVKKQGISTRFNIIGAVYSEQVYDRLVSLAEQLEITDTIHFTKQSIRYADLGEEYTKGFFINYSLDDVVGYATMDAMTLGLKTILFNCDETITEKSNKLSFCNTTEDLYNLTVKLANNYKAATEQIIKENNEFKETFYLNDREEAQLIEMF